MIAGILVEQIGEVIGKMEIITELEKGEIELDLLSGNDIEELEDTKEIDVDMINDELEKTQNIFIGEENE